MSSDRQPSRLLPCGIGRRDQASTTLVRRDEVLLQPAGGRSAHAGSELLRHDGAQVEKRRLLHLKAIEAGSVFVLPERVDIELGVGDVTTPAHGQRRLRRPLTGNTSAT